MNAWKILSKTVWIFTVLLFSACTSNSNKNQADEYVCPMHCEGDKTYSNEGSCPVCEMDLVLESSIEERVEAMDAVDEMSIYNLNSIWTDQNNHSFQWKDLANEPFILTMIYTSCKSACPRLVADMKDIASKVDNSKLKYVLVSIDPENDTPEVLKSFHEMHQFNEQWIFLNGSLDDVRELSNVVAVKYMKISPVDFSHSNIISLFNSQGVLDFQQEGLGVSNDELVLRANSIN